MEREKIVMKSSRYVAGMWYDTIRYTIKLHVLLGCHQVIDNQTLPS